MKSKVISKLLEPLAKEARKYKNGEEFRAACGSGIIPRKLGYKFRTKAIITDLLLKNKFKSYSDFYAKATAISNRRQNNEKRNY